MYNCVNGSFVKIVCLFLLLVFASSCSRPFTQVNVTARETYRSKNFSGAQGVTVAILTATGSGSGTEYRKLIGEIVEDIIETSREDISVMPYWESLSVINREGLSGDYANMLDVYAKSGMLDKKVLFKLYQALGVDYFIQPRLVDLVVRRSGRFSLGGISLIKTHETGVKMYFELWNGSTGEVEWIGVGDGRFAQEHYKARPIPFEPVAREAIKALINQIPKNGDEPENEEVQKGFFKKKKKVY